MQLFFNLSKDNHRTSNYDGAPHLNQDDGNSIILWQHLKLPPPLLAVNSNINLQRQNQHQQNHTRRFRQSAAAHQNYIHQHSTSIMASKAVPQPPPPEKQSPVPSKANADHFNMARTPKHCNKGSKKNNMSTDNKDGTSNNNSSNGKDVNGESVGVVPSSPGSNLNSSGGRLHHVPNGRYPSQHYPHHHPATAGASAGGSFDYPPSPYDARDHHRYYVDHHAPPPSHHGGMYRHSRPTGYHDYHDRLVIVLVLCCCYM